MRTALKDWIKSISFRLIISAGVFLLFVLPLIGSIILNRHKMNLQDNFEQRLETHLSSLIASALRSDEGKIQEPEHMGNQLFNILGSGWGWQIVKTNPVKQTNSLPTILYSSLSLDGQRLPEAKISADKTEFGASITRFTNPDGQDEMMVSRFLDVEETGGKSQHYGFKIVGNTEILTSVIDRFRRLLFWICSLLAASLLIGSFLQSYYGLKPLRLIRRQLKDITEGKSDRLTGVFPTEIAPLQNELNRLIESNDQIVSRARTHVGNLAHGLKTPLSVIKNEMAGLPPQTATKINEQLEAMQTQIRHHLDRARIAARVVHVAGVTEVAPVIGGLERALVKIYADKNIQIHVDDLDGLMFYGERQDLEEMVGNLMDNGAKWAHQLVQVKLLEKTRGAKSQKNKQSFFTLSISDDGPGLTKSQQEEVLKRGKRLDETKPGSGLGLSIVSDLADLYGGNFHLEDGDAGGLKAILKLPGKLESHKKKS